MTRIAWMRSAILVLWLVCVFAVILLWQTADLIYTRQNRTWGDLLSLFSLWAMFPPWLVTWIWLGKKESQEPRRRGKLILTWLAVAFLSLWFAVILLKLWSNL